MRLVMFCNRLHFLRLPTGRPKLCAIESEMWALDPSKLSSSGSVRLQAREALIDAAA